MITLRRIVSFPLKSGAGIDRPAAAITPRGLAGDRRWMVVDPDGRFLTGRTLPAMVRLRAAETAEGLALSLDGRRTVVPFPAQDRATVTVWDDTVDAALADDGGWLAETLGRPCRLVYMDEPVRRPVDPDYALGDDITSFADGFPVLLIAQASLDDLNGRLTRPVTMDHFRPNLVVDGCAAFAEDGWQRIRIGEAELALVKRCARCVFTTVDPVTGQRSADGEPLKTLSTFRRADKGVMFGQNLLVVRPGRIAVGDAVTVLS